MRPKILNISDAWELYRMTENILDINPDTIVFDVMRNATSKLSAESFVDSLTLLYGNEFRKETPLNMVSMLVYGIRQNLMPNFRKFVVGVSNVVSKPQ